MTKRLIFVVLTSDAPLQHIPKQFLKTFDSDSGQFQALTCTAVLSEIPGFLVLELAQQEAGTQPQLSIGLHVQHVLMWLHGERLQAFGFRETGESL